MSDIASKRLRTGGSISPHGSTNITVDTGSSINRSQVLVTIFLISLVVPFIIFLGPVRLSLYRIELLILSLPLLFLLFKRKLILTDFLIISYVIWCIFSYIIIHGLNVEAHGILFLETITAYLLGRCLIGNADSFQRMVSVIFIVTVVMLPFAIYESVTAHNLMRSFFETIYNAYHDVNKDPRWGLRRVQGPFEHPILFGVFTSAALALTFYVLGYKKSLLKKTLSAFMVFLASALSLSSGPLSALIVQVMMILYEVVFRFFKKKWIALSSFVASVIVLVEIVATRSSMEILISVFAFNPHTAYNRIRIWRFGSQSVIDNPLFGVGFGEWARPFWMSPSVDMFWLLPAMRHGILAGLLLHLVFFSLFFAVIFRKDLSERAQQYRLAWTITMVGFYLAGWTVHYWNATYTLFMFLLGSGSWFLSKTAQKQSTNTDHEVTEVTSGSANPKPLPYRRAFPSQVQPRHNRKINIAVPETK